MAVGKVLIIDDNTELAENIQEILGDEGVQAVIAGSGSEGLERLADGGFQLVITDMRMPGMNGLEVIQYIKQRWPGLPVVIMTAYAKDELLDEAQNQGALRIIAKPIDFEHLTGFVHRIAEAETPALVVEDDADMRTNLTELLQEVPGVVPHPADNAAMARQLFDKVPFRIAVVDIRLPDGDGLELGMEFKQRARDGELAVVYVTGYAADVGSTLQSVLTAKGVSLVEKPFEPEHLVETINDLARCH